MKNNFLSFGRVVTEPSLDPELLVLLKPLEALNMVKNKIFVSETVQIILQQK